jgi:hypothetical protein
LMMSSVLIRAMRRRGLLQAGHTVSIANGIRAAWSAQRPLSPNFSAKPWRSSSMAQAK